jgi:hypothetical protein
MEQISLGRTKLNLVRLRAFRESSATILGWRELQ